MKFLFFFTAAAAVTASKLKVDVGVHWNLCDLDRFHQFQYIADMHSPYQAIDYLINKDKFEPDPLYNALKSCNYYAPKAKLYASLQPKLIPCETFISNGKESSCVLSDVKPAPTPLEGVYEFDCIVGDGEPKFFLYSALSSEKLSSMLKEMKETVVFRPLTLLHGCKDHTEWIDLSGTAVIEFEAKSPTKKSKSKHTLPSFLSHFKPKDFSIDYSLELASIAEIALKMSQVIMDSKEPHEALKYVTSNYPTLQKGLNGVKLRKEFVHAVEKQQQNFGPVMNHIRINGFDLNADVLDYYRLLGFLKAIEKFTKDTSIGKEQLKDLVQRQSQVQNKIVYDLDMSETFFFNDLEKDSQYMKWPTSFSVLLVNQQPHVLSPFKYIRRNLFTLIVFAPLDHPQVVEVINELSRTFQQEVPLRIGFQLTAPKVEDEVPLKVFYKLQRTAGIQQAFKFLIYLKHEKKSCDEALKNADAASDCQSFIKDEKLSKYAKRFTKLTSWSNGKIATGDSINELMSGLGFRYQNELFIFTKAWQSGELTDDTKIHDFLFDEKRYTVLKEWVPEVTGEEEPVYIADKSGLQCPKATDLKECQKDSGDEYFYYNGHQIKKSEHIDAAELIDTLVKYEDAIASKSAKINNGLQQLLKSIKTELNPIIQAPNLVVNRDWTPNPELSFKIGKIGAPLELECYLNPNTKAFPKLVLLFSKLVELGFLNGVVTLNPSVKVIDYMYRDYYSFGELPELLPEDLGFAVKLDGPASWIAAVKESNVDMDNIQLQSIGSNFKVQFEVKHLVIEGQYLEKEKTGPAQGVELEFVEKNELLTKRVEKTCVMALYGYFQFKCQPAVYELSSPFEKQKKVVSISSFSVPCVLIKAELPKDWYKQTLDALAKDGENEDADTLNVFSIASGEAYERMLRIMMMSVSQQKKGGNKLKFWLFDSFVSPQFRISIAKLSQALGFEYEFISYKWPTWLLTQKTKVRTVFAYKVLFLDVIFPRSVGRVIFVDADQVARADLTELARIDMEDQVYGFVPFCDDRSDMASYRFWETPGSYWDQALQGKPYHIW